MTFAQKPKPTQPITRDVKILCPACHGTTHPCAGEPSKYIAPSCCKGKGYIWATVYKEPEDNVTRATIGKEYEHKQTEVKHNGLE